VKSLLKTTGEIPLVQIMVILSVKSVTVKSVTSPDLALKSTPMLKLSSSELPESLEKESSTFLMLLIYLSKLI
jgi:hypothetical protein